MYLRKLSAIALAILTGVMALTPSVPALAAVYGKVDGVYQMTDGTPIPDVFARGIDVSHWKQNIDWTAVAADDVQFVMLGTRYNNEVDPYFRINADGAHKAGIKLGAYIYSYAVTPEMAVQEADFVLDLIKDYPISYPVAFDVEANVQSTLPPNELIAIINAFCQRIEAAGYYPMVYANNYWLTNKIDVSQLKYDIWAARYEAKPTFGTHAIWQATSTGVISGVQGNVDINFQYKDFSGAIPANHWRTIADKTYYYRDYTMQKSTWIQDETGWFYMNAEGQPAKGWFTDGSTKFYLDSASGRMATGWQLLDGQYYYFKPDGHTASGWVNDNNAWYYTSKDGMMNTGWLTEGDSTYYLSTSSGRMTIGWRQADDGFWYYFDENGRRKNGVITVDGKMYYLDPTGGQMAVNTKLTLDGAEYQAGADGVLTKTEIPAETAGTAAPTTAAETSAVSDTTTVIPADASQGAPQETTASPGPGAR